MIFSTGNEEVNLENTFQNVSQSEILEALIYDEVSHLPQEKIEEFCKPHPIIVVDQIPKGRTAEELWENMTSRGFNKMMNSSICPFNFMLVDGDYFSFGLLANGNGGCALCGADSSYFSGYDEDLTVYAYNKARQARFEHGECG